MLLQYLRPLRCATLQTLNKATASSFFSTSSASLHRASSLTQAHANTLKRQPPTSTLSAPFTTTTTNANSMEQEPQVFMDEIDDAFLKVESDIASILSKNKSWAVIDNFLPPETIATLRQEAILLREKGHFVVSESERHGVKYEKKNVEATELDGGEQYYQAPRLHEYVVQAARTLPSLLSNGDVDLDGTVAANKLAVCLGGGSSYDKHLDNSGRGDTRKLTCLLYLNDSNWKSSLGGNFRLWHEKIDASTGKVSEVQVVDVVPKGGRMIVFFSDALVHAVMPSEACKEEEHRYALTVWLPTANGIVDIEENKEREERHWGPSSVSAFDVDPKDVETI